jgi:MFS family permease
MFQSGLKHRAPRVWLMPIATDRRRTLLATSLGLAVVQLDVSVVNVAVNPIGASLGGGVSALQWVVSAYTLAFAALILTAGAAATIQGGAHGFGSVPMIAGLSAGIADG